MSELNVNKSNSINISGAAQNSNLSNSSPSTSSSLFKKLTKEELIKALGITEEIYNEITLKNPGISQTEFVQIVQNMQLAQTSEVTDEVGIEFEANDESANKSNDAVSLEGISKSGVGIDFDKASFNKLSLEEKREVLLVEIAKNNYLFGDKDNPKTLEDWSNLSKEEQDNLVKEVLDYGKLHKSEISRLVDNFDKYGQQSMAESVMSSLQAANTVGYSLEDFNKLPNEQRESLLYDYLEGVKLTSGEGAFCKTDQEFYERNNLIANAMNYYLQTEKNENANVCPSEVSRILKDENLDLDTVMSNYLNDKEQKTSLSQYEKEQQLYLNKSSKQLAQLAQKENLQLSDPPSLYAKINETPYADKYNNSTVAEKAEVINRMLMKEYGSDADAYCKNALNCAKDAYLKGDKALAKVIMQEALRKDNDLINRICENQSATELAITTSAVGVMTDENAAIFAENINNIEDEELAVAAGVSIRKNATDTQKVAISAVKTDYEAVQMANVDMRNEAESPEIQLEINKNIAENCGIEAREYAIQTTGKLHKDAQLSALEQQLYDRDETLILSASTVPSTLHKSNQVDALKLIKNTASEMSEDISRRVELNLADEIPKCDKDNQLAMHEEIMTSKFSEVQVRAAENIKDYNPSIQTKAIDAVYKSNNSKAVDAVIKNIEKLPPAVQKNEVVRLIGELSLSNAVISSKLDSAILGGNLTARELSRLSPAQRREYYVKMFENASPAKQLAMLKDIAASSIGIHKKTIFTIIVRFSEPLLKSMVESGMGKTIIESGVPLDVVNKVIHVMKSSTSNEVISQLKELKADLKYEKYFKGDEKFPSSNSGRASIPPILKNTFGAKIDDEKLAELKRINATMYFNS